jgi:hypothetical protein
MVDGRLWGTGRESAESRSLPSLPVASRKVESLWYAAEAWHIIKPSQDLVPATDHSFPDK